MVAGHLVLISEESLGVFLSPVFILFFRLFRQLLTNFQSWKRKSELFEKRVSFERLLSFEKNFVRFENLLNCLLCS